MSIYINGVEKQSQTNTYENYKFGGQHIAGMPEWYEPQRSTDFEFVITGIDGLVKVGDGSVTKTYDNAQEILRWAIVNAPVPGFEVPPQSIQRGNSRIQFAGTPQWNSLGSINIRDFIGSDTAGILRSWQHLAYNQYTDKVGLMSEYKRDAVLIEYTPDRQVVRQWNLYGCWCSNVTEEDFNNENAVGGVRNLTATIVYDVARLDPDYL